MSRGVREQLFLSLRLALAAYYARRGAPLPLILDDVLVNFDMERAKAAGQVLRDFAAAGHQMLIFTCHGTSPRFSAHLKAPVNELPSNAERDPALDLRRQSPGKAKKPAACPPDARQSANRGWSRLKSQPKSWKQQRPSPNRWSPRRTRPGRPEPAV